MPPTLLSILEKTSDYFKQKNIESPRLNAELLIGHVLNLSRIQLYLQFDRPFSDYELESLRQIVRERGQRKPLQYITGTAWFRNLKLRVGQDVLIPRPETEILIDISIKRINQIGKCRVLDYGTGSGCIAISLLKEVRNIEITAVDSQLKALEYAQENRTANNIESEIEWKNAEKIGSFLGYFDLIVSNPPYIPSSELERLQPEVKFEPQSALDGGVDGLDFYRMFAVNCPEILNRNGWLIAEIGDNQEQSVNNIFKESGRWQNINFYPDLSGTTRVFEAQLIPEKA